MKQPPLTRKFVVDTCVKAEKHHKKIEMLQQLLIADA